MMASVDSDIVDSQFHVLTTGLYAALLVRLDHVISQG